MHGDNIISMVAIETFDRTPARIEHVGKNGAAGARAHAEFGIDFPDAYLLALKEAQGTKLERKEKIELDAYRFFKNTALTPDKVRTSVYFYTLLRTQGSLDAAQDKLYRQYCKEANVTDQILLGADTPKQLAKARPTGEKPTKRIRRK